MGYAWGGRCHDDDANALAAFVQDMTAGNATGITTFTTTPSINGAGLISWSISHRPLTDTTATTRTGTTQLPTCSKPLFNDQEAMALVPFLGLFVAFALGWLAGQQR